jgi:hypothetical protein
MPDLECQTCAAPASLALVDGVTRLPVSGTLSGRLTLVVGADAERLGRYRPELLRCLPCALAAVEASLARAQRRRLAVVR